MAAEESGGTLVRQTKDYLTKFSLTPVTSLSHLYSLPERDGLLVSATSQVIVRWLCENQLEGGSLLSLPVVII